MLPENLISSGYSSKICTFAFDFATGILTPRNDGISVESNLTFVAAPKASNNDAIYAVHEVEEYNGHKDTGAVSRWQISRDKGQLSITLSEAMQTHGQCPCHVEIDVKRSLLYVSNYDGGSFSVFQLDSASNKIIDLVYTEQYGQGSNVDVDRQKDAHAHGATISGDFLYVVDLGSDKIWHYTLTESGVRKASDPCCTETPPGFGPRHMCVSNRKAYVLYELKSVVEVYKIDAISGKLTRQSQLELISDTLAGGHPQYGAEITVHPSGKWILVSNRGRGPLIVLAINPDDGDLTIVQRLDQDKVWPRHFVISPDGRYVIVADQMAEMLSVFSIDQDSGHLTLIQDNIPSNNRPSVLAFV